MNDNEMNRNARTGARIESGAWAEMLSVTPEQRRGPDAFIVIVM
jgi:hypothetical protein